MFREREITEALDELMEMFSQVDKEKYPRQISGDPAEYLTYSTHEICEALMQNVQSVYQYTVENHAYSLFGLDLFGQRAVRLTTASRFFHDEAAIIERTDELWLLEDMTFAVVDAVSLTHMEEGNMVHSEYRAVHHKVQYYDDLCFNPDDFLLDICELCAEHIAGTPQIYVM